MPQATVDLTLDSYIASRSSTIDAKLSELMALPSSSPHQLLFESARYSVLTPGKRLRPLLVLATVEAFGEPFESALVPACAIEILHTYSLIHDDLPCMDDDDMRRGKPTVHKLYGEGHAVLTGDFLLTFAFELLAQAPHLSDKQKIAMISILSQRAGANGMVGGQAVDLLSEGKKISWQTLEFIHLNKTGALISACLEFGAILANASSNQQKILASIGNKIGLAFQIIDDILEATSTQETLGKPVSSDMLNEKSTSISVLGIEKAKGLASSLLELSQKEYQSLSLSSPILGELLEKLVKRSS